MLGVIGFTFALIYSLLIIFNYFYHGIEVRGFATLSIIISFFGSLTLICLGIIGLLATLLFMWVYRLSSRYGEHGLMKKLARKRVPQYLKISSRKLFMLPQKSKKSYGKVAG